MATARARSKQIDSALLSRWRIFLLRLPLLPRHLKISYLLFFSHILLVVWLIVVMSYNRYRSEWNTRVDHSVEVAHLSMNPIIDDLSLYASGLSYANINLPATRKLFTGPVKLLYFQVDATSDFSGKPFRFAYSSENDEVWRTDLGPEAETEAAAKLRRLEEFREDNPEVDTVKYSFLANRAREQYQRIVADREKAQRFSSLYHRPSLTTGLHALDEESRTLHILLPLHNANGGEVWAVFSARDLLELRDRVLADITLEAVFAFLVSCILIVWATWWIVQPLRRLASYMDHDVQELNVADMPELTRNDEIGQLARCFRNLVNRIRSQFADLERLAIVDSLTGLGSRRLYESSGRSFIKQARRSEACFGMLVIDVDNFKLYNDTYGHSQGDEGLRMIGRTLKKTLQRETDLAFRFGGEEFVVMIQVAKPQEVRMFAEQIREAVLAEKMEHVKNEPVSVISVSIGGVVMKSPHKRPYPTLEGLFRKADQALYKAKSGGRNRVEMAVVEEKT